MEKPRVRDSVYLAARGDELIAEFTNTRRVRRYRLSPPVLRLLGLLDGQRTRAQVLDGMRDDLADDEEVARALAFLRAEKIIEDEGDGEASARRQGRYARQMSFFGD